MPVFENNKTSEVWRLSKCNLWLKNWVTDQKWFLSVVAQRKYLSCRKTPPPPPASLLHPCPCKSHTRANRQLSKKRGTAGSTDRKPVTPDLQPEYMLYANTLNRNEHVPGTCENACYSSLSSVLLRSKHWTHMWTYSRKISIASVFVCRLQKSDCRTIFLLCLMENVHLN